MFDLEMSVGPNYAGGTTDGTIGLATNTDSTGDAWDQMGQWQVPNYQYSPTTYPPDDSVTHAVYDIGPFTMCTIWR